MNFLDLAKTRYTTKRYNTDKEIPGDRVQQLKEILRLTPSSFNSQPWRFTFVSDKKTKSELAAESYFNEKNINEASLLVVFSAIDDIDKFEEHIRVNLSEGAVGYYNHFLKPLPEPEIKSWLQHQVYLSLGFFLSACTAMEIDATPMEGIKGDAYNNILKLDGYRTLFSVAIGYRHTEDANQPSLTPKTRLALDTVIHSI